MYYVLTKSGHPFGNKLEREVNVLKGKWDLSEIEHDPLAYDLIRSMISADPALRYIHVKLYIDIPDPQWQKWQFIHTSGRLHIAFYF